MRPHIGVTWGIRAPVTLHHGASDAVRLRTSGTCSVQVTDGAQLVRRLVDAAPQFRMDGGSAFLREAIESRIGGALDRCDLSVLGATHGNFAAAVPAVLAAGLSDELSTSLTDVGLGIAYLAIEDLSLHPEDESSAYLSSPERVS